jgi:hypothetical protein
MYLFKVSVGLECCNGALLVLRNMQVSGSCACIQEPATCLQQAFTQQGMVEQEQHELQQQSPTQRASTQFAQFRSHSLPRQRCEFLSWQALHCILYVTIVCFVVRGLIQ